MTDRILLGDYSWPEVEAMLTRNPVVIVPVGAFEQHGHHLPLRVDEFMAGTMAQKAARLARDDGTETVVTPTVWTGYSPHHRDFPGTITLDHTLFGELVMQIARSLHGHGFRRILLLNGHGGNIALLRTAVQALRYQHGINVACASYWDFALKELAAWRSSAPGGIMHACEMETALMLAHRPDLVDMDKAEDVFLERSPYFMADLLSGGAVTAAASFAELSPTGVIGAPTLATEDRGKTLSDAMAGAVAAFLGDFATWDIRPTRTDRRADT